MIHIKHVDWGVIAGDVTKAGKRRLTENCQNFRSLTYKLECLDDKSWSRFFENICLASVNLGFVCQLGHVRIIFLNAFQTKCLRFQLKNFRSKVHFFCLEYCHHTMTQLKLTLLAKMYAENATLR